MERPVEICGKVPEAMDAISPGRAWPGVDPDSVGVTQNEVRACSACSGDYEDPDRTAPVEETERHETVAQAGTRPHPVGRPEGFSHRAEEP